VAAPKVTPGPRPAAVVMDSSQELDVDDASLLEESGYDGDFAVSFHEAGESTSVGVAPPPRSSNDESPARRPPPRRGGGGGGGGSW
jgi:hypothetical protein